MKKNKQTATTQAQKLLSVDNKNAAIIEVPVKIRPVEFADPLQYEIVDEKKAYFSKDKAFEFLELAVFEGEREVRQSHVQMLFDEWQAGRFLWHNVTIARAILGSQTYRINGQHTSWMRVNVPDSREPINEATVQFRTYKVKDSEQLRALYSAFDRNAPRTNGHITKVLMLDSAAGHGIPGSYYQTLVGGFRMYKYPFGVKGQTNIVELIEMIKQEHDELFGVVGAFYIQNYKENSWMRRAAVMGAMFATFEKAVKASEEFWQPVLTGIGLDDVNDPRNRLRRFQEAHSHGSHRGKEHVSAEQSYRVCINCWNYWRKGELVQHLKVPKTDMDRPKVRS